VSQTVAPLVSKAFDRECIDSEDLNDGAHVADTRRAFHTVGAVERARRREQLNNREGGEQEAVEKKLAGSQGASCT
jgi:hypothetical protein